MNKILSKYDLIKHFGKLGLNVGAEIGVAQGHLSEAMFDSIPGLKLYCVDIWQPYRGNRWSANQVKNDAFFKTTKDRLEKHNAIIIKDTSMNAIKMIPDGSLDFVYIDSNHSYDYVMEDLIHWTKKVRKGGMVTGDDYYDFRGAGVIQAVDDYTKAHGIKFELTDPCSKNIRDRNGFEQPTFYWTKK